MAQTTTENEVLAAAQSGDPTALGQLIRMHKNGVYRYGLHVCRTTEDAEDALQETLWAVTRGIKAFRGTASSIGSWMFTIIRRECYRLVDRRQDAFVLLGSEETDLDEIAARETDPGATIEGKRRSELLALALRDLDRAHREVILLRDIQEFTAPEAAARLGISVGALKSRLHRPRAKLHERVLAHVDRS